MCIRDSQRVAAGEAAQVVRAFPGSAWAQSVQARAQEAGAGLDAAAGAHREACELGLREVRGGGGIGLRSAAILQSCAAEARRRASEGAEPAELLRLAGQAAALDPVAFVELGPTPWGLPAFQPGLAREGWLFASAGRSGGGAGLEVSSLAGFPPEIGIALQPLLFGEAAATRLRAAGRAFRVAGRTDGAAVYLAAAAAAHPALDAAADAVAAALARPGASWDQAEQLLVQLLAGGAYSSREEGACLLYTSDAAGE